MPGGSTQERRRSLTSWVFPRSHRETLTLEMLADDAVGLSGTMDPNRRWDYMHVGVAGHMLVTRHRVPTLIINSGGMFEDICLDILYFLHLSETLPLSHC